MKKMKDLIVHKPNELIEITGNPISVFGLLTYNLLLHKFQKENIDKLIISGNEIFESLQISDNYDELYSYLDSLLNIKVISKDKKGKLWGAFHLLSEYKKIESGIFIQIPDSIFKALCNSENEKKLYYTTIKLLEQRVYKCSYTIIFYELFKKYEKVNIPIFLLKDLKELTGTSSKYTSYYDFKRYVIFRALKELNQFDKVYEYSFKEELIGKTVQKIQFLKVEKNVIDLLDKKLSEKLVKTIEKARKNRFVDLVYSQKAMDKIITKYEEADVIKGLNELYKYNSEIKNFSKILISKIEDIKNSKMELIKTKVKIEVKPEIAERIKSDLDSEKEKLSLVVMQSELPTSKKIHLFTQLSKIETFEELEQFKV
ncbi:MAG: hypothetical protein ACRC6A_04725, partial [Fusobacteriaceae bacterium]